MGIDYPKLAAEIDKAQVMLYVPCGSDAEYNATPWRYFDQKVIASLYEWSVFMMYWPQIAFFALIGRE